MQPEKEKRNPLSDAKLQPSCLQPVRNPFKIPDKMDKDLAGRQTQRTGGDSKRREESDGEPRREDVQKENVDRVVAGGEEESRKLKVSDTYKGKHLPAGMKIKRISDEERKAPKTASDEGSKCKVKENYTEPVEAENNNSTLKVKMVHPEKMNQTSKDVKTGADQNDPPVKTTVSKCSPSTQVSNDSDHTEQHASSEAAQPTGSAPSKVRQDDSDEGDDDDVILVSAKPATHKTPPVAAVQKTLTAFAGFQPASNVASQQGASRGQHSLLTAQLQQKKVSFFKIYHLLLRQLVWLSRDSYWRLSNESETVRLYVYRVFTYFTSV